MTGGTTRFTPGTGFINQNTPGLLLSSTVTPGAPADGRQRDRTSATRTTAGDSRPRTTSTTRSLYRSSLGIDPPRFEPFGDYTDPPQLSGFGGAQVDEWPYAPRFTTSGGNRAGLASYHNGDEPFPRLNLSSRFAFQDDLSIVKGSHNIKMGLFLEYNRKTEPGSANYMGNFDFGHNANNPLSTGNGYANMLLGVFTTYTELTNRVDRDVRHWQNDAYIQDNWRVTPRLTIDYGLRIQHSGSYFEVNEMNSGFFADQWNRSQAPRVYRLVCMDGRPGNQACAANLQRAIDPANPNVFSAERVQRQHRSGLRQHAQRHPHRRDRGQKTRHLLHLSVLRVRAARRLCVERVRRRQDGAARLLGDLL